MERAFYRVPRRLVFERIIGSYLINPKLPSEFQIIIDKALEKDCKLRYQSAAEMRTDLQRLKRDSDWARAATTAAETGAKPAPKSTRWAGIAGVTILIVGLLTVGWQFFTRRAHTLTDKDTIVFADFTNTTGDPIFDGTLKQALTISLQQSPFLSLLSDQQVQQTLRLMGRPGSTMLSPDVASEICQRNQSKAMLVGKISALGTQYLLSLDALNCATGASLVQVGRRADRKDKVLEALGQMATELRERLGESLVSVRTYDKPLEEATTKSVEALRAFTLGQKTLEEQGSVAALPFYKRAIELDPDFAIAYGMTAVVYLNIGDSALATEYTKRAYALRDRVTEREKLMLEMDEAYILSGDLSRYAETLALYKRTYPREKGVWVVSSNYKINTGDFEGAIQDAQHALAIQPTDAMPSGNLYTAYISLNRFDEAKAALDRAVASGVDSASFAQDYYMLAFLRNDYASMEKQFSLVMSKGEDSGMLSNQSETEAFHGHLRKAREYSQRAVDSARREGMADVAAGLVLNEAVHEVEFGNFSEARKAADAAMRLSPVGRSTMAMTAVILARAGEDHRAQRIQDSLTKEFPRDTFINVCWLPLIRAAIELNQHNPKDAIESLRVAQELELGCPIGTPYLRGYALLAAGRGTDAAAEFQKVLDRPGIIQNSCFGSLAHLGLGRALVAVRETEKARAAYQDFFALWKDADPDIPILKQAKAEYAKL